MKILIIYPMDYLGKKIGGIESCIRSFVANSPPDWEIEIVGLTSKSGLSIGKWHDITFEGKTIKYLPILSIEDPNKYTVIPLVLKYTIALLLFRHRIDFKHKIINFHRIEPAYVLSDVKSKKILFIHGYIRNFENAHCENKWKGLAYIYFLLEPYFIEQMAKIFVVSQIGCEYYKNRYPKIASRYEFLPTWYEPETFNIIKEFDKTKLLESYGIYNKFPVIIYVGRLEQQKDPLLLLDSFFYILKKQIDAHLLIVGEGKLKDEMLMRVNKLGIANSVSFVGRKTHDQIPRLLNASDLFVLTSAFEGMPMVVLEALACGLPVVSTDSRETRLVVKDEISGKIVTNRDPQSIAEMAVEIIGKNIPKNNCQKSVSEYSKDKILNIIYRALKEEMNG